MKLKFSEDALFDFKRLYNFIKIKNPTAANTIPTKLAQRIRLLTEFPESGKKVLDSPCPEKFREIFILDYHVRYMFSKNTLMILRIWHQKEIR